MQKNEGVLFLFKRDRFEEIFGWHWYVCLKKNKHQHIAFKIRIWDYDSFGKLIHFISDKWEKRKVFFEKYKIIYPRLISLLKWKFDYVFLKARRKMKNQILENLCNKIVDVVHETFTRKYYFVKISQSKKGHIYLIVRKKRGVVKKTNFIKKYFKFLQVFFSGTMTNTTFWAKNILSTRRWSRMFLDITFTIFWFRVANMLVTIFEQFLFPILVISWSALIISCSLQAIFKIDFILCGSCFKNFDV